MMKTNIPKGIQFLGVSLNMMIHYLTLQIILVSKLPFLFATNISINSTNRSEKLLSIFSVVQFKNTECKSNNTLGICVTVKEVKINIFKSDF